MIFCLLAFSLPVAAAPGPQSHVIDSIGTLGVRTPDDSHAAAINNLGHVAGYYLYTNAAGFVTPRALRWDGSSMTELSSGLSHGSAINDEDAVVGFKQGTGFGVKAHLWELTGHRNLHLGPLEGSEAVAINAQGEIAGSYDAEAGQPVALRQPFLYLDSLTALTFGLPAGSNAWAVDLNERGDLLGNLSQADGSPRAFLRHADGRLDPLPDLGGGAVSAMRLNNRGHVAALRADGQGHWHPILWTGSGIVSLDPLTPGGEVLILDLSDDDVAVGMARDALGREVAVRWHPDGSIEDLNRLLLGGSGWQLTRATGCNELGEICGDGFLQGVPRGWRMSPAGVGPTITGVVGGRAGVENDNRIFGRGFTPNGDVAMYGGFSLGHSLEPICGAALAIAEARPLGTVTADGEGRVVLALDLPLGMSGHVLHVQALDLNSCGLSERNSQGVF